MILKKNLVDLFNKKIFPAELEILDDKIVRVTEIAEELEGYISASRFVPNTRKQKDGQGAQGPLIKDPSQKT